MGGRTVKLTTTTETSLPKGAWQSGLCDCCSKSACCSACCFPCCICGQMAATMTPEEVYCGGDYCGSCFLYSILVMPTLFIDVLFSPFSLASIVLPLRTLVHCPMRSAIRKKYNIPGDDCEDCFIVWWCSCCALVQVLLHTCRNIWCCINRLSMTIPLSIIVFFQSSNTPRLTFSARRGMSIPRFTTKRLLAMQFIRRRCLQITCSHRQLRQQDIPRSRQATLPTLRCQSRFPPTPLRHLRDTRPHPPPTLRRPALRRPTLHLKPILSRPGRLPVTLGRPARRRQRILRRTPRRPPTPLHPRVNEPRWRARARNRSLGPRGPVRFRRPGGLRWRTAQALHRLRRRSAKQALPGARHRPGGSDCRLGMDLWGIEPAAAGTPGQFAERNQGNKR